MKIYRFTFFLGVLLFLTNNSVNAQGELKSNAVIINMQTSEVKGGNNFKLQKEWTEEVERLSGGRLKIKLHAAGSIVKHVETLDAIRNGDLGGHITSSSYFTFKDPAFGLLGNAVGAWSDARDMRLFIEYGGGREIYEKLHKPYGVKLIGVITTGVEAFISKIPIDTVEDLKGLRMRAPEGMVYDVFLAVGAKPIKIPLSEVKESLKNGSLDAADYSVFSTNHYDGYHDLAPHPIYPGFHSVPTLEVSIGQNIWDKLEGDLKDILEISVNELGRTMLSSLKFSDRTAVNESQKNGITIHNWDTKERKKFRNIAKKVWAEYASNSPVARDTYEALILYLFNNDLL